ncbi:ATP-binding protein [Solimonas soli]|uniref:ATP-binding protein n=1 Tax=Solimonas soli TaxID=413479 RepID=UPI0004AFC324|nr:ATP-binding protein [Solimonas soli]
MTEIHEAELSIGPKALDAYSRLSYTMWFALAEFVDNSTQSRLNHGKYIDEVLEQEGAPLTVKILHDRLNKTITIEDNSIGMTKADLIAALRIAHPTPDSKGRSKYGMGMKTAACWIGRRWQVITCEWGSGEEWTADIDVDGIANNGAKVPLTLKKVDTSLHYTKIIISDLRRVIQKRSEETIMTYLGSMYMFDLRKNSDGKVGMKLVYNETEVAPPDESDWDTDPSGAPMRRDLPEKIIDGKKVSGWIGVLRKGGRKFGGFSLFQNERQIQGFPNAWKPRSIFGGVDEEGGNNLVAQRLTGVLLLDGFVVSHTKDAVLFQGDEEDELERFLIEETKDYRDYAQKRRSGRTQVWSKEKVRDLVESMRSEFTSTELKDALNTAALPPPATVLANNQQMVKTLSSEDVIAQLDILDDLRVIVSLKETSEWEPHLTIVAGAEAGVLHVIVNGLHPYYQSLESNDAIEECVHQYIYDAVAEYRTSKIHSPVNPDSVRRLKNDLLRARSIRIENAAAAERKKAEADLFAKPQGDGNA